MVGANQLDIVIQAKDQASRELQTVKGHVNSLENSTKSAGSTASSSGGMFSGFGVAAAAGIAVAAGAAIAFGVSAVKAYSETEKQQKMLEHAVVDVSHATREQLKQTEDLANALERKGVLDGDNIKQGLAQLSTFGLSNNAVRALGGSLADLAVNQYGVTASGEQLSDSANMIAKALNGQFGVLEKSGIRFTEAQKAMIQFGTEQQKVDAINQGFQQNLKYTNEIARQTSEGAIAALNVSLGNIQETIGGVIAKALVPLVNQFKPVIDKISAWTEANPELAKGIVLAGMAVAGLAVGFGILAVAIGAVETVGAPVILAILAIIAALALIGAAVNYVVGLFGGWGAVWNNIVAVYNAQIKPALMDLWNTIQTQLIPVLQDFWDKNKNWIIPALKDMAIILGVVVVGAILGLIETIKVIVGIIAWFGAGFTATVEAIKGGIAFVADRVTYMKNHFWESIGFIIGFFATLPARLIYYVVLAIMGIINWLASINWWNVLSGIWSAFSRLNGFINDTIRNAINSLINANWGNIGRGIGNALIGMLEGAINGAFAGIPGAPRVRLPRFEKGVKNFEGGYAIVGEAGPELVKLPSGSDVIPNHKIYSGAGNGGGGSSQTNNNNQQHTEVNYNGPIMLSTSEAVQEFFRLQSRNQELVSQGLTPLTGV